MRIWLLALLSICAIAAAVLFASETQRRAAQENFAEAETASDLLSDMLEQDQRVSDFLAGKHGNFQGAFVIEQRRLQVDLHKARDLSADDPTELAELKAQQTAAVRWHRLARFDVVEAVRSGRLRGPPLNLDRRDSILSRFVASNTAYRTRLAAVRQREQHQAALVPVWLVIGLGLLFSSIAFVIFRRQRRIDEARRLEQARESATEAAFADSQTRFGEAMQVAQDQPEAHELMKRHLEDRIADSSVIVLNRNNSANRLEPAERLGPDHPLSERLAHAEPRSCLAVRLSRHYQRGDAEPEILACEVCGGLTSCSSCQPLLVGGEVIGSVLVQHKRPLQPEERRQFDQSVNQAAPVLANLRNLAIAQTQAVTDALTGLPNKRAFDDTFKRLLAQAGRSVSPLSIVLLDLDHFKQINDTFGHERGDEVLAALGVLMRGQLRAGDFPARYGGEEFMAVLPDTDRSGAMKRAEGLRRAVQEMKFGELKHPVTASFGVSTYPDDSADPDILIRMADRALYAAKQNGRNRVETVSEGSQANGSPASREAAGHAGHETPAP